MFPLDCAPYAVYHLHRLWRAILNVHKLLADTQKKWMIGTTLTWSFFDSESATDWDTDAQREAVTRAWQRWIDTGVNLNIMYVDDPSTAIIRIAFRERNASKSYVGNANTGISPSMYTMNLGWDVTDNGQKGTAEHEIGHALGLDHEHQHPECPLVWDVQAVIDSYRHSQGWSEPEIQQQVLSRVSGKTDGTTYDSTSVMHYPFAKELIKSPPPYSSTGIGYNDHISVMDVQCILKMYPPASSVPRALTTPPVELQKIHVWEPISPKSEIGLDTVYILHPKKSGSHLIRRVGNADVLIVVTATLDKAKEQQIAAGMLLDDLSRVHLSLLKVPSIVYHMKIRLIHKSKDASYILLFSEA